MQAFANGFGGGVADHMAKPGQFGGAVGGVPNVVIVWRGPCWYVIQPHLVSHYITATTREPVELKYKHVCVCVCVCVCVIQFTELIPILI